MSLADALVAELDERLAPADADLARRYPGEPATRQPVHTVYIPADRFGADTVRRWGAEALALLDRFGAPAALGVDDRVRAKLAAEPIEDLRVDFEDGYGNRGDAAEDSAINQVLAAWRDTDLPPWFGIRFKSFEAPTRARGLRTLTAVVAGLAEQGPLPEGFWVTLPKVTSVDQVRAMAYACDRLESELGLAGGSLRFEIQVETAQAIMSADGTATVAAMVHAAEGRCTSLHYGTFDYSAGLGIAAAFQSLEHPVADHAKAVMQVAAAQTGVRLSDGSTNVVAFGTAEEAHATWALHARLVTRSLRRGYYQGWDMHPGHLPTRFAATYAFYREAMPAAAARLKAYVDRVEGGVMDEPATARALAMVLLRGRACGALDPAEVAERAGLDDEGLLALA